MYENENSLFARQARSGVTTRHRQNFHVN